MQGGSFRFHNDKRLENHDATTIRSIIKSGEPPPPSFVGSTRKEDHKNHHHKNLHPNSPPTPDISRKSATVVASSSRRRYCSLHGVLYSLAVLFWVGATVRLALIHFQNDHPDAMTRSVLLLSSSSSSSSLSRTGWSPISSTKAIQRPTLLLHDDPRGEEVAVTSDQVQLVWNQALRYQDQLEVSANHLPFDHFQTTHTKNHSSSSNNQDDDDDFLSLIYSSACLIVKDDNHWLVEWMAHNGIVFSLYISWTT